MLHFFRRTVMLLLLLAACGRGAQRKTNEAPMNHEVTLQCHFDSVSASLLEVRYTLSNRSARPIYVFTPLTEYHNNQFVPAPARVYVQLSPNGLVTLSKQLWKTPEMVSVFMPEVPFLTRVAAGGRLEETVHVSVPIIVNYPYLSAGAPEREQRAERREATTVTFAIGYVREDHDLKVTEVSDSPGLFAISYGSGISHQKLISCEPVPLKATVIVR